MTISFLSKSKRQKVYVKQNNSALRALIENAIDHEQFSCAQSSSSPLNKTENGNQFSIQIETPESLCEQNNSALRALIENAIDHEQFSCAQDRG